MYTLSEVLSWSVSATTQCTLNLHWINALTSLTVGTRGVSPLKFILSRGLIPRPSTFQFTVVKALAAGKAWEWDYLNLLFMCTYQAAQKSTSTTYKVVSSKKKQKTTKSLCYWGFKWKKNQWNFCYFLHTKVLSAHLRLVESIALVQDFFQSSSSLSPGLSGFKVYVSWRTMLICTGSSLFFPLLPLTFDVSLSFSEHTVWTRLLARFHLELQLCSISRTKFGLSPNAWHAFSKVGFCWLTVGDAWPVDWLGKW